MSQILTQPGECLASLSEKFGFPDFHTILDHGPNAAFKAARLNPNMLLPNDSIEIPDIVPKKESLGEDSIHEIRVKQPEARLKLRLADDQDVPFAGKKFTLTIGSTVITGTTDGDGLINEIIPPGDTSGEVIFFPEGDGAPLVGYSIPLQLGFLHPPETISGLKARLFNLGYPVGPIDEVLDPLTVVGVNMFQKDQKLTVNGTLDAPTKAKILKLHDGN